MRQSDKEIFLQELKSFAAGLAETISRRNEWNIRGFIDIFRNIYTISSDSKVISKLLELHLFPQFLAFAERTGYTIELAEYQNWYPDLTFIRKAGPGIKFAVDLKTTYRMENHPGFCNGFTLGSHGKYFIDRNSTKNIQYPYSSYSGHFCLGIIYSRTVLDKSAETMSYRLEDLDTIPPVIGDFLFFAEEKWKIASDKGGSGNTANIGSIRYIPDIVSGNGVFARAGEEIFDDYWINFGKLMVPGKNGGHKAVSSLSEYLDYRGMSPALNNAKHPRRHELS